MSLRSKAYTVYMYAGFKNIRYTVQLYQKTIIVYYSVQGENHAIGFIVHPVT